MGAEAVRRALAAALLMGCACLAATPGRPGAVGTVQVRVHDHREAIDDFARLDLTVEAAEVHPSGAPRNAGWISLPVRGGPLDLTRHVGPPGAVVAEGSVPAGRYDALRLTIPPLQGTLKTGAETAVGAPKGGVTVRFLLRAGAAVTLTADIRVSDNSDHAGKGYEASIQGVTAAPEGRDGP